MWTTDPRHCRHDVEHVLIMVGSLRCGAFDRRTSTAARLRRAGSTTPDAFRRRSSQAPRWLKERWAGSLRCGGCSAPPLGPPIIGDAGPRRGNGSRRAGWAWWVDRTHRRGAVARDSRSPVSLRTARPVSGDWGRAAAQRAGPGSARRPPTSSMALLDGIVCSRRAQRSAADPPDR